MASQDYWVIKYKLENGTKHLQHIGANYEQYDVEKIRKIFKEIHPDWEILKVYPTDKLKFKEPDGG